MTPADAGVPTDRDAFLTGLTGHAYPWDISGDPSFADRVRDLGFRHITLASSYHSVRAATPLHPDHQLVEARYAALYRPVRPVWNDRVLVPRAPEWMQGSDPFRTAAVLLGDAGLDVNAWIVLNHNSRLGREHPELAAVNCFGDRYPYALCPQQPAVRDYAALLAVEAARDAPITGVTLEAWGQLGVTHNSLHDKTAGAWNPTVTRLLSICCCSACQTAWGRRGADAAAITATLRRAIASQHNDDIPDEVDADTLELLLSCRHAAASDSLDGVLHALAAVPGSAEVTIFATVDPWAGASLSSVSEAALGRLSTVIQGAWSPGPAAAESIRTLRSKLPKRIEVAAYVSVLPPVERAEFPAHIRELVAAGASRLNLYHLGLAGRERQVWLRDMASH